MSQRKLGILFFALSVICCALVPAYADESEAADHSTAKALAAFHLADPSLQIELVAAEPDVIDPVAIAWDERGRMFVAEMRDYPLGPIGGKIRMLEDLDGDGRYETSHVFAEGLPFPNSVMPWRGGVLVSAAPDVIFLKDTDGDNKADLRKVILTGFGEGNQQLRVNSLFMGLDNWVYAANGRSDGAVLRPGETEDKAVHLGRHDLRFNPDTLEFQPIAGLSQFGLCEDDWGNRFLSWNTVPIRHVVIEEEFLARNAYLASTEVEAIISEPTDTGRVYPIAPQPQRYNRESVEFFNASCGLHVYRGDALPELSGNAFICEPLTSLVHRKTVEPSGATFIAKRADEGKEFLASTDLWFRPVNVATGPDGALYIVDFCRKWIEHPAFVPKEFHDQIDWRTGESLGRIWRIRKKEAPTKVVALDPAKTEKLVDALESENAWSRMTAQRLLVEGSAKNAAVQLHKMVASNPSPKARVHALYTLQGIGALERKDVAKGLKDSHPAVRRHALLLSRPWLSDPGKLASSLNNLAKDKDARVRLELAQLASLIPGDLKLQIQIALSESIDDDPWQRLGLLTGLDAEAPKVYAEIWKNAKNLDSPGLVKMLGAISETIGAYGMTENVQGMLNGLNERMPLTEAHIAIIAGLAKGFDRANQSLAAVLTEQKEHTELLDTLSEFIIGASQDEARDQELRVKAIDLAARGLSPVAAKELPKIITSPAPETVRIAAINALVATHNTSAFKDSFEHWLALPLTTRRQIIQGCLANAETTTVLLDAIDAGQLELSELNGQMRETLLKYPDAVLAARAQTMLAKLSKSNRVEIVQAYMPALKIQGDAKRGELLFKENCMPCHMMQGVGNRVGPDLSGIISRSKEKLLSDILDPNAELSPDFVAYTAVTSDFEVITGVMAGETPSSITLRQAQGIEQSVRRETLQELRASTMSLMPEGLEAALDKERMADLLEYLHKN